MLQPASAAWLLAIVFCVGQLAAVQGNVLFRFSLNFNVKDSESSDELLNNANIEENSEVPRAESQQETLTTSAPWADNLSAMQKLLETKAAVQKLNGELTPLVGRSDELAAKLKQGMHYFNNVSLLEEQPNVDFGAQLDLLRKYVDLVEALRAPSEVGGMRTLEYVLLKLALEKYGLLELQHDISKYLLHAEDAWINYKKTKVVVSETEG